MTESSPTGRVTPAELARHLGVSRAAVSKAIKTGRIAVGEDGRVDPVEAERQWLANTRPKAKGVADKSQGARTGYAHARARKETALARMAELQVEQATGVLAPRDDFDFVLADLAETLRGLLETLPDRLAPSLAAESDPLKIHAALRDAADALLNEMADQMTRRVAELDA
jgi:phage terminase Nu1 subunit (DNA packaging protein)